MKKLLITTFALCLAAVCVFFLPQEIHAVEPTIVASGSCGESVTWTLDDQGLLIISGTGAMSDFSSQAAPWAEYCDRIHALRIEEGVTAIGAYAFQNCENLTAVTIADTVTILWQGAFENCGSLTEITVPDSVERIESAAFSGCGSLQKITIPFVGNSAKTPSSIDQYPFGYIFGSTSYAGSSLTRQVYCLFPDIYTTGYYYLPDSLTSVTVTGGDILDGAFHNCRNLKQIVLPESATIIGHDAFLDCHSLVSIEIPDNIKTIGTWAFHRCHALESAVIGDGVTHISEYAFQECENLKTVEFGSGLVSIGENAFFCCGLTSLTLPEGLTATGVDSFGGCSYLAEINLPSTLRVIADGTFTGCAAETIQLPDGLVTIGSRAFADSYILSHMEIPNHVTEIGDEAFRDCWEFETITLGQNLQRIGFQAFYSCQKLQAISIPATVTEIGENAFFRCVSLDGIRVDPDNQHYCSDGKGVLYNKNKTALYFAPKNLTGTYNIPYGVVTIAENTFDSCRLVEKISLPDTVQQIGQWAFYYCESLTETNIPNGVEAIGPWTYAQCYQLQSITIPDSVRTIGENAFYWCHKLKTVNMGAGVTSIGESAFTSCDIETIDLPSGLLSIGDSAFYSCTRLKEITIPASVESIGYTAFYRCDDLNEIVFLGDAPSIDDTAFSYVVATAYYPAGNTTWTEEVRQNYGGELTWVAVENEAHTVTWVQATTSLEGNIGLNFYVKLSDSLVNDPTTAMRFVFNGVTMDVPLSQAVQVGDQYKFTCPVSAKNMADTVNARIVTSAGGVGDAKNLAVMTYCNYMIQYSTDTKLVSLMKAMLNYGASAQILFNHNTDNLANASLSEADKQLADVDASAYAHSVTGSEAGIQVYNATLLLETETTARIYFKLTGDKTIDQYTFMVDGAVVQAKANGDLYYVEIPNIAAQHLDEMHTVIVGGLTIRYGGLSYVNQVIKNPAYATEAMTEAAKALFAYNKMAETYFH